MARTGTRHPGTRLVALVVCATLAGCAVEPVPLEPEARSARTQSDLSLLKNMSYVPEGPITLHDAMARAVAFNLERRVKEIEREIEDAELTTKSVDMLPALELDGGYNRSTEQLSATDDRITRTASASITWNVLDLGVSYARAKQQADQVMVARERERKALQDIIRRVRAAYWRAAGAERLMGRVQSISDSIKIAMRESRTLERSGANDVAKSVSYRREIIDSVRQALGIQRELREARAELAELLNIRPGTGFRLAGGALAASMPSLPMSLEEMETHALENRPELRIEDYNERMSVWQAREAMFDMLPGPKLSAGTNYSSDRFNLAPNWLSTGFQLGMNLFGLFAGASRIDEAEKRGELARRQRLAMTLAVMTQTHMAYVQFRNASQQMRLAREVARADRRLARLVATDTRHVSTDYFEAVRLATKQLQSEMDEHRARIGLVSAHSDVMHAVGLDVIPDDIRIPDIETLRDEIRRVTAQWETQSTDLKTPSDTPLDHLVNAMLEGGEPAPGESDGTGGGGQVAGKPVPPADASDAAAATDADANARAVRDFETASGGALPPQPPRTVDPVLVVDPGSLPPPRPVGIVQLGVFRSGDKATRLRERLTRQSHSALFGVDLRIVERAADDGTALHYVETPEIPDPLIAQELCASLRGIGEDCVSLTRPN